MAIADTITSMQNHTSNAYTMIGYGTDLTGINKNLENLSSTIFEAFIESLRDSTTLYTNLPKISGNGTQITLNDTANAPMRITLKASELSQDATPTPDSPQDIHTISGDNSVVVNGSNFLNNYSFVKGRLDNGVIGYASGTTTLEATDNMVSFTTNNNYRGITTEKYIPINSTYVIFDWETATITPTLTIAYYGEGEQFIKQTSGGYKFGNGFRQTVVEGTKYIRVHISLNSTGSTTLTKPRLNFVNDTTTALPYEPYVSQTAPINLDTLEYCKIGNYEDKFILTSGKNLFNKNDITTGKTFSPTGGIVTLASAFIQETYIPVLSSTQYTISTTNSYVSTTDYRLIICEYDENKNFIQRNLEFQAKSKTITTTANTKYVRLCASNVTLNELQFEKGTATEYEPYGTNQWYLKKNIGKVVLDGSESGWWFQNNQFRLPLPSPSIYGSMFYSQHFEKDSSENANTPNKGFIYNANYYKINNGIDGITDIAGFKTWLSNNNDAFYYILREPTYTQITGTLETQLNNIYKNMLSYKGTTNVSQINNDLPFVLGVSAIQDLE